MSKLKSQQAWINGGSLHDFLEVAKGVVILSVAIEADQSSVQMAFIGTAIAETEREIRDQQLATDREIQEQQDRELEDSLQRDQEQVQFNGSQSGPETL